MVLANAAPVTHNFSPLLDGRPGVPAEQRYKALGGTMESGLMAYVSPDGIHWKRLVDQPVLTKDTVPFQYMFDSQNLAFWSEAESQYVCFFRVFKDDVRRICRTTSADFVHWSAPVLMEYRRRRRTGADRASVHEPDASVLSRAASLRRDCGALHAWPPGADRRAGGRDRRGSRLLSRHVGRDVHDLARRRHFTIASFWAASFGRESARTTGSRARTIPALNVVQTGPTEMSVYVNQDYAQPTAHLRRYSLRLDGFASAQADYAGGELVTKPLVFQGRALSINFATSAAGGIRVELQRPDGSSDPRIYTRRCRGADRQRNRRALCPGKAAATCRPWRASLSTLLRHARRRLVCSVVWRLVTAERFHETVCHACLLALASSLACRCPVRLRTGRNGWVPSATACGTRTAFWKHFRPVVPKCCGASRWVADSPDPPWQMDVCSSWIT